MMLRKIKNPKVTSWLFLMVYSIQMILAGEVMWLVSDTMKFHEYVAYGFVGAITAIQVGVLLMVLAHMHHQRH